VPLRLITSWEALPGKRDQVVATYTELCPFVRQEPGCLGFDMFQDIKDPDRFVLLERWASKRALTAHGELLRGRGLDLTSLRQTGGVERWEDEA